MKFFKLENHPKINLKFDLIIIFLFLNLWIIVGSVGYYYLENWNAVDSFYFAVITLTTVGYGEMYPTNDASKIFTAIYSMTGVFVFLSAVAVAGAHLMQKIKR